MIEEKQYQKKKQMQSQGHWTGAMSNNPAAKPGTSEGMSRMEFSREGSVNNYSRDVGPSTASKSHAQSLARRTRGGGRNNQGMNHRVFSGASHLHEGFSSQVSIDHQLNTISSVSHRMDWHGRSRTGFN
jgi:hypothetical protein